MFLNRCYDMQDNNMMNQDNCNMQNNMCPPVMECPKEVVCHRQMCYDVQHIVPINTRIINHHVYRHTYQPCYTYTMEDEVSNVYERNCNF